MNERKLL